MRRLPFHVVLLTLLVHLLAVAGYAQTRLQTLHTFNRGADGAWPRGIILAADGNYYGLTAAGGAGDMGTIFRMTPSGEVTVLHSFDGGGAEGAWPIGRLLQASDGNFYGTTSEGGAFGLGTVFSITPDGTFTVLHAFAGGAADGASPEAELIQARDGDLYGTTPGGGAFDHGTTFRMTMAGEMTVLHSFAGLVSEDGARPFATLLEGRDGNFYGSTRGDWRIPATQEGTIFRMTPAGVVTVLHHFDDHGNPQTGLVEGADGSFYGTTFDTIFRLTADGTFTTLPWQQPFGAIAPTALWRAADGTMYGTAVSVSPAANSGIFRMNPDGSTTWLHVYPYFGATNWPRSGNGPMKAPPVLAADGSLFGTMEDAPDGWSGSIFRLTEQPPTGFDGDTLADMAFYDRATGRWRILTSESGYATSTQIDWGGPGYTAVPADYDGDGRLDVAVYRASTGMWSVLKSAGGFTSAISLPWGGIGYVPVPGDYDGDRKADFTVFRPATGTWYILPSRGGSARTIAFGGAGDVPVPGDYDGDGITDLALYHPATGVWQVLTSQSGFTALLTRTLGGPGYAPVPGDYDGDTRTDFAVYDQALGYWSVLRSSTDFTTIWTQGWGGTGYTAVPGDYDNDGRNDLAVYNAALGEWFVLQSSSDFTTTLRAVWGEPGETVLASGPVRLSWTDASRATDYDGDGLSDLAVYEPSSGVWSILDSSTNFTVPHTITWGGAVGDVPVPGDYDGDGRTDVATFNDTTGLWSAQLTSGPTLTAILGSPGDIPVARDYDGDLITDLAVYTPSTGVWRLLLSSTGFTATTTVTWGGAGWIPVPGDYDGDGKTDLAVYQSSTAQWRILFAATNFTTQLTVLWGGPGYTVVPGDFDGDGKVDFAACRNADGQWYVLKSGFTYTSAFGLGWGAAIDAPLDADYDGDGIADMASYDATTGQWYVRLSSSDFTLTLARTLGGPGFIVAR